MESYRPPPTNPVSGVTPRRGPPVVAALLGGLLIVAGVLLVTVPCSGSPGPRRGYGAGDRSDKTTAKRVLPAI
jgi:hypothetical protein